MDLTTVRAWRTPADRTELALADGEAYVAGGTWLFSEPQPATAGLVDLTALGWAPWEPLPGGGLRLSATCTLAEVQRAPWPTPALAALARQAADALLMSWKVQAAATIGGNLCLGLPAGAMTSLTAALGGEVVVWTGTGERREPVSAFVTGPGLTSLRPGEVLRAVDLPGHALASPVAFRRMALTERGRSAAVVIGRRDPDALVLSVTASTPRPAALLLPPVPDVPTVRRAVAALGDSPGWYQDPHGDADWRAAMTERLALEVCEELSR